jgi:hypothetical protein
MVYGPKLQSGLSCAATHRFSLVNDAPGNPLRNDSTHGNEPDNFNCNQAISFGRLHALLMITHANIQQRML